MKKPSKNRNVKTCPVLTAYLQINTVGLKPEDQSCITSRCRWWIGDDCAVPWFGRLARAILMRQFDFSKMFQPGKEMPPDGDA